MPDIFSDCFGQCIGVVNQGSPGPICGWLFSGSGSVTFIPGQALFQAADNNEFPQIVKSLPAVLPTLSGITVQWFIHDAVNGAPQLGVFSQNDNEELYLQMNPDGSLTIDIGPVANESRYAGTWAPIPGTPRKIVIVIDNAGVPTLFIDDVVIPLVFQFSQPAGGFPANSVLMFFGTGTNSPGNFSAEKLFIASGNRPFETFCCPST